MKRSLSFLFAFIFMCGMLFGSCTRDRAKNNLKTGEMLNEAQELWSQYNLTGCKQIYQDILKKNPDVFEASYWIALIEYHYEQKYDTALDHIKDAIKKNPGNMKYYVLQGDIHFAKGEYEKSLDSYKLALGKDPSLSDVYYRLSQSYIKLGSRGEAVKALEEGFRLNPFNGDVSRALHRLYVEDEEYSSVYDVWKT